MSSRPERIADQIRVELAGLLAREVHDPGLGFLTLTRAEVTRDLQIARIYYTALGDEKARRETARALLRATPFLRRLVAQRIRLRRAPELEFFYDESIARQDRIEQILQDLKAEATARNENAGSGPPSPQSGFGEVSPEPGRQSSRAEADGTTPHTDGDTGE